MSIPAASVQALKISTLIKAPLDQVYHCFSTPSGWLDWFAEKGFGFVSPDNILELDHPKTGKIAFRFVRLEKNTGVSFRYINLSFPEASDVDIRFEETQQGVQISLTQSGLTPETQPDLQAMWEESLEVLKALFETGRDPRLWGKPFLGVTVMDWITPEYAAEHQLTAQSGMLLGSVFEGKGAQQAGIQDGDVIVSLEGRALNSFDDLHFVFSDHRAGDTLEVSFYHGEQLKTSQLTLSEYPVPEVPANTQDIAEKLARFYQKVNTSINQLLEDKLEAQTEYRPAAGEWNAKDIIAHLIAYESDVFNWLSSYIAGQEIRIYTSQTPATLKTLTAVYPGMDALLGRFRQIQQELTTLLSEVPADVVCRKPSMVRLALSFSLSLGLHYKEHLNQLKETLEAAADVRGS